MALGVIIGGLAQLRIQALSTVLPISSIVGAAVTQVGNRFSFGAAGQYVSMFQFQVQWTNRNLPFAVDVFNITTNTVVGRRLVQNRGAAFSEMTLPITFTVINPAHLFEHRITVPNANTINFIAFPPTNYQAVISLNNATGGSVGPGTVNQVAKFTGANVVGDSRWTDPGGVAAHLPNGPINMQDAQLIRSAIRDYGMVTTAISGSAAPQNLDMTLGNVFDVEMTGANTFAFVNPPVAGTYGKIILFLRDDGGGPHVPTFPVTVIWPSGAVPPYATPSLYAFMTVDAGATWFGVQGGNAFA